MTGKCEPIPAVTQTNDNPNVISESPGKSAFSDLLVDPRANSAVEAMRTRSADDGGLPVLTIEAEADRNNNTNCSGDSSAVRPGQPGQPQQPGDDSDSRVSRQPVIATVELDNRRSQGEGGGPREIHKPTPAEIGSELDKMNLDPEVKEVAEAFSKALQKGDLRSMVDAFAEIVKEHSSDPEALKKGADAINQAFGNFGYPLGFDVKPDGSLHLGGGALIIHPDGKIEVNPVHTLLK